MAGRVFWTYWDSQDWLSLVLDDTGVLRKWWDIAEKIMRLSSSEVTTALKIMMWDIYEELPFEARSLIREWLLEYEKNWDSAMWLLTVIALYDIVSQKNAGKNITIPDDVVDIYDFVKSEWFEITMFHDLFNQIDLYRSIWKMHPPEMIVIWQLESAKNNSRERVKTLLGENS